jgi:hypothetical protein
MATIDDSFITITNIVKNAIAEYIMNTDDLTTSLIEIRNSHILAYVKNKRKLNCHIYVIKKYDETCAIPNCDHVPSDHDPYMHIIISTGESFDNKAYDIYLYAGGIFHAIRNKKTLEDIKKDISHILNGTSGNAMNNAMGNSDELWDSLMNNTGVFYIA